MRCGSCGSGACCGGGWSATYSWTADALFWAFDQDIEVTNNSNRYGARPAVVTAAYETTRKLGMTHFVRELVRVALATDVEMPSPGELFALVKPSATKSHSKWRNLW